MSFASRRSGGIPGALGSHAASVAAGARDGLRAAHYLVQELASSDAPDSHGGASLRRRAGWLLPAEAPIALINSFVAQNARIADQVMNWSSDAAAVLLAPDRRGQPSAFNRNMMDAVAAAVAGRSLTANALFNAYFHRAADRILRRSSKPPYLVLENRIDAARKALAGAERPDASDCVLMARVLTALVRAAPVVEAGDIDPKSVLAKTKDPNAAVAAVACVALLFGTQGQPNEEIGEERFFAIVGALIAPRLAAIEQLIARDDLPKLETELAAIKALY